MPKHKSIKQPVTAGPMRPRVSRHGKSLAEVYTISIPEISRVVTKQDPKTGEFTTSRKVVQAAVTRAMTPAEIEQHRAAVLRARGATMSKGRKNTGGDGAGKKKVKVG